MQKRTAAGLYALAALAGTLAAQPTGRGPEAKLLYGHDLKVRPGGNPDWPKANKVGVEVFQDDALKALIAITETGHLAVAPAGAQCALDTTQEGPFAGWCSGDCNGDRTVSIAELIGVVGIALGRAPIDSCAVADRDGSGAVLVNEVLGGVGAAIDGCPAGADVVLRGGAIFTADPDNPRAEALAICGERLAAVGSDAALAGVVDAHTTVIELGVLNERLGYFVRRAQLWVFQDFIRRLSPLDLSPAEFSVLVVIGANTGLSQSELAMTLGIERARLVRLLHRLERRGLTQRLPSSADGRRACRVPRL